MTQQAVLGRRAASSTDNSLEQASLGEVLAGLIADAPNPALWSFRLDGVWAYAHTAKPLPIQGWKLHVSATVGSAESVLRACAGVLLAAGCNFKVASTSEHVQGLTDSHCPAESAGKVLTAYPGDDDSAVTLAQRLDVATRGFDGPRILSDRPFVPGSLVHYRFGAFTGIPHVSHDGDVTAALMAPDGTPVADSREVGRPAPEWASRPFVVAPAGDEKAAGPRPVMLADRYVVQEAIRHAYRGGVFRAVDQKSGLTVVVKQARANVGAGRDGLDVRDRLRHEAAVLQALAGRGWVPELVDTFEQDGDVFVIEQFIPGLNLRQWVNAGVRDGIVLRPVGEALQVLARAATVLVDLHAAGVVVRDFSPNNVVVGDSGQVVLVDLELADVPGIPVGIAPGGTRAYGSPEQFAGSSPHRSTDAYALGAVIAFTLTGEDPLLWLDTVPDMRSWLAHGVRQASCPPDVADLVVALCSVDPAARPTAAAAADMLRTAKASAPSLTVPLVARAALQDIRPMSEAELDAAIAALLDRLLADVHPGRQRVARSSGFGESTLATNVQHGAAGILGAMVSTFDALHDDRLLEKIHDVARWLELAVERHPATGPVGLYFGYSGPLWALADAGVALGDPAMVTSACERALALPTSWPSPDVTHGVAGLGLTLVHLWQLTGDRRLRDRVLQAGGHLLDCAELDVGAGPAGPSISWRTPRGVASTFAGGRFNGFAHGTAGIGLFLEHAALVTKAIEFADAATLAAQTLARAAVRRDGMATWGSSPERPDPGLTYWCNGSSGVATFLSRHAAATGDQDQQLLGEAALSLVRNKWKSGISYCHGLSGDADLLLDLAETTSERYRDWAGDLLRCMWARRVTDTLGPALSDEPGQVVPDFNVGYGGPLTVLLRLRHGGARSWLPALRP